MAAGLLELPLLMLLVTESSKEVEHGSGITLFPSPYFRGLLSLSGHGASTIGNPLLWAPLYWSSVFVLQVAMTAPFIRVVFGFLSSSRRSRGS
jgi:hypothetical protein